MIQFSHDLTEERRAFNLYIFWELDLPCVTKFHIKTLCNKTALMHVVMRNIQNMQKNAKNVKCEILFSYWTRLYLHFHKTYGH